MKKIYPTIKDKYRFLGGWNTIPKTLLELVVGKGYEITPSGETDYIIRGASKLIMINQSQLDFYFEPFIDYFADPEIVEEEGDIKPSDIHEEESNSLVESRSDIENEEEGQLCLF